MSELVEVPKEGERVLAASRRPDGTLRKPVRIRAGYTPQDEVAVYQSKAVLFKQGMPSVPPGYDPEDAAKPKTKAAKKNEKRKEKKQQAASSSTRPPGDSTESGDTGDEPVNQKKSASAGSEGRSGQDVGNVVQQMNSLSVSQSKAAAPEEDKSSKVDLEKRIRALRKKIRLSESLQASSSNTSTLTPKQVEKLSKLDTLRKELEDLESKLTAATH
ncbi:unnamed protein product [Calypogeia fissa]